MLPPGQGQLYWHVLLGDQPQVVATVREVQSRLAGFNGLDPTPHRWLHITVLMAGLTRDIAPEQRQRMVTEATRLLQRVPPIVVRLSRMLYHPEAIALAVSPGDDLTPLLEAVQAATRAATGDDGVLAHQPWTPHLTVAYSSARQPAAPIIAAVGRELGRQPRRPGRPGGSVELGGHRPGSPGRRDRLRAAGGRASA